MNRALPYDDGGTALWLNDAQRFFGDVSPAKSLGPLVQEIIASKSELRTGEDEEERHHHHQMK